MIRPALNRIQTCKHMPEQGSSLEICPIFVRQKTKKPVNYSFTGRCFCLSAPEGIRTPIVGTGNRNSIHWTTEAVFYKRKSKVFFQIPTKKWSLLTKKNLPPGIFSKNGHRGIREISGIYLTISRIQVEGCGQAWVFKSCRAVKEIRGPEATPCLSD